ncbi:MAG: metal-dependent hydrolase [Elusimicrobia bacterium]|nr:metal-dependent hydrolase [Elusimicrobiota bacterium]
MNPITHFMTGWVLANGARLDRRDRAIVTLAGIIPDIDGAGIIPEFLTRHASQPLTWGSDYHHCLHTLPFAVLVSAAGFASAKRRPLTAALAWLSFHLHLFEDILGSRGPDGYQWPIPYLAPFSQAWALTWKHQWQLDAWPNIVLTAVLLAATLYLAWKRGYSPAEMVSTRADQAFIAALRNRFQPRRAGPTLH